MKSGMLGRIGAMYVGGVLLVAGSTYAAGADHRDELGHEVLAETANVTILQDGAWVRYDYAEDLADPQIKTYYGQRTKHGGCSYSGEEYVGPEATAGVTEEREIANDEERCVMITEIGVRRGSETIPDDTQLVTETPVGSSTSTEVAEPTMSPAATRTAWHKTYYEDPASLDVNSAKTNVSWSYNGSCVTDSWNHVTNYGWYSPSGWRKDWSKTSSWQGCSYARTTSNSNFFNGAFCVGIDTHTEYLPNYIRGEEDGGYYMTWDANKWGGCTWLLSFHRSHDGS